MFAIGHVIGDFIPFFYPIVEALKTFFAFQWATKDGCSTQCFKWSNDLIYAWVISIFDMAVVAMQLYAYYMYKDMAVSYVREINEEIAAANAPPEEEEEEDSFWYDQFDF